MASFISSAVYYIAPDGDDSAPGTLEKPFASLIKGCDKAAAGDTVYIRGGRYLMRSGISIRKSGSSDKKRIWFLAYQKERPVFDFSGITTQTNGVTISNSKYLYFKGLDSVTFRNSPVPLPTAFLLTIVIISALNFVTFIIMVERDFFSPTALVDI
jgi:hypothetical protein